MNKLRVIIADDERPARLFLKAILQNFDDVKIVGEAENGIEAVEIIKSVKPDLALLDLQMPEATGIEVVKLLRKDQLPLVAFVTAYDEFAVKAFELNAIDYLLKPIEQSRLRETVNRAIERMEHEDFDFEEAKKLKSAIEIYGEMSKPEFLERIPVRVREEIVLVPVRDVASIVADGELLHLTTLQNQKYNINYRLKDIETRLESGKFVRLSRGSLASLEMITKISPMPGGTYLVSLKNGQEIASSRIQSKLLRDQFLKL
jgi:DNA-binding LytR/AlgR family response regulator